MERLKVIQLIEEQGMVPLFFHSDIEVCKQVVKACYDGGARLLEFTSRGTFAHEVFSELSKYCRANLPGMVLGVGSVTDAAAASMYMLCGADFVVTPAMRKDIAIVCNRRKVLFMPGCATLSEICAAEELGCEIVKLFPGSIYGPNFIKSVIAPQPWTKIMPTGGVSLEEDNLKAWFAGGAVCVGMGSKLISKDLVKDRNFEELTARVSSALKLISTLKG